MHSYAPQLWLLLLTVLFALHAVRAATKNDVWTKCTRSIPRSFTRPQQELLCVSSSRIVHDPTAPGQCAKVALGGRSLQSAKVASRVEMLRAVSIIQLCSGVQDTGPAQCWTAISAQIRQQVLATSVSSNTVADLDSKAAAIPLVQVCKNAQDDRPAQCLLLWFEISRGMSSQNTREAIQTAVALCKRFSGQTFALKQCVKQATPHLGIVSGSQIGVLQLCQFIGDGKNLPAVVECAFKLGKKHISPSLIAQVCSGASDVAQPHTCFVLAQQKLRWMSQEAQMALCTGAVAHAAIVPVNCALEMQLTARRLLSSDPGIFVANLCSGATNATIVTRCLKLVPTHAFTASQILRLCAASAMAPQIFEKGDAVNESLYPTRCATQARLLLQRSRPVSIGGSSDLGMSASAAAVQVCEQATSDAPSKCLAVTKHDRTLPTTLRVQLCQRASSDSPQQCFRSLRKFINARRMDNYDAVMTCRQAESIGPTECVAELFHATALVTGKVVAQLCHAAKDVEPARCFAASPTFYDDELKVLLCNQAESAAPALCAKSVVTRFAHQPPAKVSLCRGATTAAPAACAMEAPFGMDEESVVELCRSAKNTAPAQCAQEVLTSLNVPWHRVAQVCAGAVSTTPGRCLAHYVRHSRLHFRALADHQVVVDCRHAVAQPSALRITKASYACPELRPKCPLQIVVSVLDQYGDPIVDNRYDDHDAGVVYMNTAFTGSYDKQHEYMHSGLPALQGSTYAKIVNGSAVFSNLIFTEAGVFTFTFRAGEGVSDEVARVVVHPDLTAEALQNRCEKLFTHFQCSAESAPTPKRDYQRNEIQILLLPRGLQLSAVTCGEYWMENIGGLAFRGFSATKYVVYVLPRPFYDLFTSMDIPRVGMSAWAVLGLKEGEARRPVIRRAYHQRSLEWHPDKWHALAASLPPIWQQELGGVYVLITQAYDQLTSSKKLVKPHLQYTE